MVGRAQLIHHTINNFNTAPDKLAISRIQSNVSSLEQERERRLREAETALKSTLPPSRYIIAMSMAMSPNNKAQEKKKGTTC